MLFSVRGFDWTRDFWPVKELCIAGVEALVDEKNVVFPELYSVFVVPCCTGDFLDCSCYFIWYDQCWNTESESILSEQKDDIMC